MRVTLLGHASVLVELDGATCLMEPVLGDPFEEGTVTSCPRRTWTTWPGLVCSPSRQTRPGREARGTVAVRDHAGPVALSIRVAGLVAQDTASVRHRVRADGEHDGGPLLRPRRNERPMTNPGDPRRVCHRGSSKPRSPLASY